MNNEENDIDLIEAYYKGELRGEALQSFERRRASDAAFEKEVADYLLIIQEIRTSGEFGFRDKLQQWENELSVRDDTPKVVPMWRSVSIAATLVLFALAGTYIVINTAPSASPDELFQNYFRPYEDVISSRSGEGNALQSGMALYNEKKYREAIPFLQTAKQEQPDNLAIPCYLGISYLAINDPASAKAILQPLLNSEAGLYRELAQWNLALAYLKSNEVTPAKAVLKEIAGEDGHMCKKQAREVLDAL